MRLTVDSIPIVVNGCEDMSVSEIREYIRIVKRDPKARYAIIKKIIITVMNDDEDNVILDYETDKKKFCRIRRITGYLVGDMDRWNSAKYAEEHDRIKHSFGLD